MASDDAAVCTVQFAAMYTIAIYQITFGPDLCSGMRVLMALRLKEPLLIQETPLPQNSATIEWQTHEDMKTGVILPHVTEITKK